MARSDDFPVYSILIDEDHLYLQSAREHLTGYIREMLQASACQP